MYDDPEEHNGAQGKKEDQQIVGGSRQGSHKMTPARPKRALWVVDGLEPPPRFFEISPGDEQRAIFCAGEGKQSAKFRAPQPSGLPPQMHVHRRVPTEGPL